MDEIDANKLRLRIAGRLADMTPGDLVALDFITQQIVESRELERTQVGVVREVPVLVVLEGGLR
jgi:hypothetical protein